MLSSEFPVNIELFQKTTDTPKSLAFLALILEHRKIFKVCLVILQHTWKHRNDERVNNCGQSFI